MKKINIILIALTTLFAFACSDDNEVTENTKGTARISITDAPIDDANVEAVFITINSVEAKSAEGWVTLEEFKEPIVLDLLSYQNGESYFLTEEEIAVGNYSEVRMKLDIQEKVDGVQQNRGCYIEYKDGSVQPLFVPSGGQSGYKAIGDFEVPAGGVVNVTLDFDVRKAIVKAGNSGKYILKPTIRLVTNDKAGLIDGTFVATDTTFNRVVVFAYDDDTFDNSELDEAIDEGIRFENAVTSGVVAENNSYTLAFMNAGIYDLYFVSFDENGDYIGLIETEEDVTIDPGERKIVETLYVGFD